MCMDYAKRMRNLRKSKISSLHIAVCLDYIYDHLHTHITAEQLAKLTGLNISYLSRLFKKETGQSFVSYLTDYRMDRAEEMVLNTDEKSYKIAEKVGYQDANYFSYVFKKKFGVSPSKYRASGK